MKKFVLILAGLLSLTSFIFANDNVLNISEVYAMPEETAQTEEPAGSRHSLGFGLSILGFEISYMNVKNHFEIDTNLAYANLSDFGGLIIGIDDDIAFTNDFAENYAEMVITPKICMGYNTLPGKKGWTNTFGGFLEVPFIVDFTSSDFGAIAAAGFWWRGAKSFNNVVEVGISTYLPFVMAAYYDKTIEIISIIDNPAMSLASIYSSFILCSLDFKFYLN